MDEQPRLCVRWGEALSTELMAGSKKRPLLSGYYRLMEMALQLCSSSGLLTADGDFSQAKPSFTRTKTTHTFGRCTWW